MVKYLAESSGKTEAQLKDDGQLNVIPGFIDPADMRELKRIIKEMGVKTVMFPDTSGVLDLPQDGHYRMFPSGGATMEANQIFRRQRRHDCARPLRLASGGHRAGRKMQGSRARCWNCPTA